VPKTSNDGQCIATADFMKRARAADPCDDRAPANFERKHVGIANRRVGIEDGAVARSGAQPRRIGHMPRRRDTGRPEPAPFAGLQSC